MSDSIKTSTSIVFFHGDSETGEEVLRLDMATGEPHYSERAPSEEWQGGVSVSVPLWGR